MTKEIKDTEVELEEEVEEEETEAVNSSAEDVKTDKTEDAETESTDIETDKEDEKSVPYARFKTKVDEVNQLKAELEKLKGDSSQQSDDVKTTDTEPTDEIKTDTGATNLLNEKVIQYEQVFNQLYQSKLAQIPEDYHDLIPDVDDVSKLAWIENAISKGLFTAVKPNDFGNMGANPTKEEAPDNSSFIRNLGRKFN